MTSRSALLCIALVCAIADAEARSLEEPGVTTPDGRRLYGDYCAVCHGSEGRGDGPVAAGLKTAPSNLRRLTVAYGGIFPTTQVRESIDGRNPPLLHGTRDMPVWGEAFKRSRGAIGEQRVRERIDLIIDYLQTLQEN